MFLSLECVYLLSYFMTDQQSLTSLFDVSDRLSKMLEINTNFPNDFWLSCLFQKSICKLWEKCLTDSLVCFFDVCFGGHQLCFAIFRQKSYSIFTIMHLIMDPLRSFRRQEWKMEYPRTSCWPHDIDNILSCDLVLASLSGLPSSWPKFRILFLAQTSMRFKAVIRDFCISQRLSSLENLGQNISDLYKIS